jgi:hypothetical protein
MAIDQINIGSSANDGTGEAIRDAFEIVNENFTFIQEGLSGTQQTTISATSVTGGYVVSNTYIYATTYANANTIIARGNIVSGSNLFVQSNGAFIVGNVKIVGNLEVTGTQATLASTVFSDPIFALQYSPTPLLSDNSRDVGLIWQYYKGTELRGFLGWQNSTRSLVYFDDVAQSVGNVITQGTPGNVQFGQLLLSNTTVSSSNVTGALVVRGGVGVQGNVNIQSNIFVGNAANVGNLTVRGNIVGPIYMAGGTDTIYIGGSPVATSLAAFAGGAVPGATQFIETSQSTSTTTGAVTISGGLGVSGNVFVSNLSLISTGNIRGNIIGNVITSSQPFITSLGTLSGLTVSGATVLNGANPSIDVTFNLGSGTSNRWNKLWVFDIDFSGAINGIGSLDIGGGLRTTNNTQATTTTTGALQIRGGASINTGNLYIGGSGGQAIVAIGNIGTIGNVSATDLITAGGGINSSGNINTTGDVFVTGNISVTNNLTAVSDISTSGNLSAAGNISTTQNVNTGNIVATGILNAVGNISTASNIAATGDITVTGNISTSSNFNAIGNVTASGNIIAVGNLITISNVVATGNIQTTGNVISQLLYISNGIRWSGNGESFASGAGSATAARAFTSVMVFGG